ncbi:MAG: lytic transglycosylase domain-containing protein [Mycobacteriales bacterium]
MRRHLPPGCARVLARLALGAPVVLLAAAVTAAALPVPAASRPAAPVGPAHPAAVPAATVPAVAPVPEVAPPRGAVQPTALVVPTRPVTRAALAELAHRTGPITVLTGGVIRLAGLPTGALGVDPASFRAFTPAATDRSAPLWAAVARGEAEISFSLARARRLRLGSYLPVGAGGALIRIGAEADFGLPQAALVVSLPVAAELGLARDELLVGTAAPAAVGPEVEPVLGPSRVIDLLPPPRPPVAQSGVANRPTSWAALYQDAAATCPGLSWTVLAAIGQIESADGQNDGPSTAGALGPMQFLPSTWVAYGYDPDGDGHLSIYDPVDAVYSAARLLCEDGAADGSTGLADAVFAYNHAHWYVRAVLQLADAYARMYGAAAPPTA